MLANLNTVPTVATLRRGGLPGYIQNALVYLLAKNVDNALYPNKIGNQIRADESQNGATGQDFPGRALAFDGVDQYAYVADNGALDVNQASTDFVFSTNMKVIAGGAVHYLCGKLPAVSLNGRYGFYRDASNRVFGLIQTSTGTTTQEMGVDADTDTDWYNYAIHIDLSGSKVYFYLDGTLVNAGGTAFTGTFATMADAFDFVIGAGNDASGAGFANYSTSQQRDARIYHKDITSAANLTSLQKGEALGDEVAWWWCEGTDTLEVHDASGNDYHLTAANFDSTSFVEGNWVSLMNKYGYAVNVNGDELNTTASAVSDPNGNEADATTGFTTTTTDIFESQSSVVNED
jgi:hypothetical protein